MKLFFLCVAVFPAALLAQRDAGRVVPVETPIHLVAMGDFGTGSPQQKQVAVAMARRHSEDPYNMGVTMGDNFYLCGVRSLHDKKWQTRWEDLYTPLKIPFFAKGGSLARTRPSPSGSSMRVTTPTRGAYERKEAGACGGTVENSEMKPDSRLIV